MCNKKNGGPSALFFFSSFSQRAVGNARATAKEEEEHFFFRTGNMRRRSGATSAIAPSRRHRNETRKTPPDQVVIEREDILPSSVSAGNEKKGKNDDDDQKKAGNSKGIAKRNGQKTDPEDAKEMDWKEYYRSLANERVNGVGCSPVALILLLLAFDVVVEIARILLAENPEQVKLLLFFYDRLGNVFKNFGGSAREEMSSSNSFGGLSLVCGSSALTAIVIFTTCILIGLNDVMWTSNAPRRNLSAAATYVACTAFYAHLIMYFGEDVLMRGSDGNLVSILRHLEWMFTTPILIILAFQLQALSFPESAHKRQSMYASVVMIEVVLIFGVLCHFVRGNVWWLSLSCAFVCFFFVMYEMGYCFFELSSKVEHEDDRLRFFMLGMVQAICWSSFPLVFLAKEFDFITAYSEHEWYLIADVCTKSAYSYLLCQGNIRVIDIKAKDELEELHLLTEFQRDFFFNITHELRMPLNSVIGFNTLAMENGRMDNFSGELIKNSLTSAEALLGLINQVLDYAKYNKKMKANKNAVHGLDLSEDAFTLEHLISQTMDISQQKSDVKRVVDVFFEINPPHMFCEPIVGDYFRIRQCLVNLVDNAIKYSATEENAKRRGIVNIVVNSRIDTSEVHIEFNVNDNGIGIPKHKHNKVFIPFSQPSDDSGTRKQGTGLGLSITRAIIECMGGTVTFKSMEGFGTTFTIELSLKRMKGSTDGNSFSSWSGEEVTQLPKDLLYVLCENSGSRKSFLINLLECYGIENKNVLVLDTSRFYEAQEQIQRAIDELDADEKDSTITPVVFTYAETLMENIANFIDMDHLMCIFGTPSQLIQINKGRFEYGENNNENQRERARASVSEVDVEKFLNLKSVKRYETCMTPVRPGEFFKVVQRLAGISTDADMDPTDVLESQDFGGSGSRDEGVRESLEGGSSGKFRKVSSKIIGIEEDATADPVEPSVDTHEEDTPNAVIVATGLKIPENTRKVSPKVSLRHEADWDLDISSMRVLLVEDNLMSQKVASVSMATCNVTTHIADNGKIACNAYKHVLTGEIPPYDVILMDQMMPEMNGTEATVYIREMENEARQRWENGELENEPPASALIIGLSANVGPEHISSIQQAGMSGTLSKPFYPSTLRGLLRDVYLGRYMGFREADSGYVTNAQAKPGN